MINDRLIDQAFSDLRSTCGGVREDYFGLLYLEQEHNLPRERALNHVTFGGRDYGVDGFHFDRERRNLYLFQFKYSDAYSQFKSSLQRLIADGVERIFTAPNKDDNKNQILLQLRSCLIDNRALIDQVCFRFVFTGDPAEADNSKVLQQLRDELENRKYLVDEFFSDRKVGFVVEFRSSSGRVGPVKEPKQTTSFDVPLEEHILVEGPRGQKMFVGFVRLADLARIHDVLGPRFFHSNIRYGLGEAESVNRAISATLKQIILDGTESPAIFAFNHNGITLHAERVDISDGNCRLRAPSLLNGAQTVTTLSGFLKKNAANPKLAEGKEAYESIRVLCKVITGADQPFVTHVTVNNNRQNPVEPWNLRANDIIQLELQDKFRNDIQIYYERQENAFDQLSAEDLNDYGIIEDSKAIQMLKLTQAFLLTDGNVSRLSEMRRVFEDDKAYGQVFRPARIQADSRYILLCYKVQFRLKKMANEIEQKGQNKYAFVHRSRHLLWALTCQALLNSKDLEALADQYGTSMTMPADLTAILINLATTRVRLLLGALMDHADYRVKVAEGKLDFLRSDRSFDICMGIAYDKWGWLHKKLQ